MRKKKRQMIERKQHLKKRLDSYIIAFGTVIITSIVAIVVAIRPWSQESVPTKSGVVKSDSLIIQVQIQESKDEEVKKNKRTLPVPSKSNPKIKHDRQLVIPTQAKPIPKVKIFIHVTFDRYQANVYVDKVLVGNAPCSLSVTKGAHELKLVYTDIAYQEKWTYLNTIYVANSMSLHIESSEFKKIKI